MIRRSPPKEESWESYKTRFPHQRVTTVKRVFEQLERYVEDRGLEWTPKLLPVWASYKKGRENRVTVLLRTEQPVKVAIKMR